MGFHNIYSGVDSLKICCTGIGIVVDSAVGLFNFQKMMDKYPDENTIFNNNNFSSSIEKFMAFTETAFREAVSDAGLYPNKLVNNSRVGMVVGSSLGIIDSLGIDENGNTSGNLIDFSWLMEKYHIKGPIYTVSNTCVSGINAIAVAMALLEQNHIDICIVGGVDIIGDFILNGFSSMNMLSKKKTLELFSQNQDGTILSSGAGFLVLEKEGTAKTSYAKILSCTITNDAYDLVRADMNGYMLQNAILECIQKVGLDIIDINLIMTCANGMEKMDIQQANLISKLFMNHDSYLVSSIKPLIGHTLGASGILDVIVAIEYMNKGEVLPLGNTNYYDLPSTFLKMLHGIVKKPIEHVLLMSVGFSGVNGAVLICNSGERS